MITELIENGVYRAVDEDRDKVLCTIMPLGNNTYRAINMDADITAKVEPINDYTTRITPIEHKRKGKDGRYRKTTKLLNHNLSWLDYMLEEIGFIRKKIPVERRELSNV